MQVDHTNNLNLEGEANEIAKATIDEEDLPFIIDLITRQQYRDPVGSIVREITSNCFDAHVDAGVDDPVEIAFGRDEFGKFISFTDVGTGMSPTLMDKVFLHYGKSPKRASNNFIGGFGLGGKSPLAYNNQFYITTVHNEILYEYIIHKGEKLPTIELISEESTERRNGTTVKLYLNIQTDDYYSESVETEKFLTACLDQLTYFDNVYFGSSMNLNNDYKIYEGDHFKLRSDIGDENMHLCIGKVKYPIDWKAIGKDPIGIPVGIKFEIGELIVTPERESVRYIKVNGVETAEIIAKKVDLVVEELRKRYYKTDLIRTESIFRYLEIRKQEPMLTIGNRTLKVGEITKLNVVCTPLEGFPGEIKNDVVSAWTFRYDIYKSHGKGRRKLGRELDRQWISMYRTNLYLIKNKVKPDKNSYIFNRFTDVIYVGKISVSNSRLYRLLGLNKLTQRDVGKIQWLNKLRDLIEGEIRSYFKSYEAVVVPPDHKPTKFFKASRKEGEIVVFDMTEDKVADRKKYLDPKQFETYTGFIIFAFEEDEDLLLNFLQLFKKSRYDVQNNNFKNSKVVAFLRISNANYKYFRKLKHAVHVSDFVGNNKVFKHFATTLIINKEARYIKLEDMDSATDRIPFSSLMPFIYPEYLDDLKSVAQHKKDYPAELGAYGKKETDEKAFADSIVSVAYKYNLIDEDVYNKHKRLNNYVDKLELLNDTSIRFDIIYLIVDFLVLKGKKVASIWNKPQPYEIELLKESIAKVNYLHGTVHLSSALQKENRIFNSILTYHNYVTNNA